jgi:spatacsin
MWRRTTRNRTRGFLYDYPHKQGGLKPGDEEHHQILLKITTKYPNTSFASALKGNAEDANCLLGNRLLI